LTPAVSATNAVSETKTLVVAPSWIGDTIMMQPLLARLHERYPGIVIDVLAPAWSAPLLARMPEIRHGIASPFGHGRLDLPDRWRLGRQLARQGYDRAIVLPNTWKAALPVLFAGIRQRTGFTGEARFGLLNDRRTLDENAMPRLVERYAHLADPAGTPPPQNLRAPRLASSPVQQAAARAALGLAGDSAPVVFCPGAEYGPAKRWPARHFAKLAEHFAARDIPVWLIGSAKDHAVASDIAALGNGTTRNLCGATTLEQAIDLIAGAQLVVSNDSGLMHVAAALDRPLAALYGSSSPTYTPPLSPRAKIVTLALDCSPCFKRRCPLGHLRCLEDLSPEGVLAALQDHA
jgi:heptosyltransferase-2